jgi:hypothetical protein
MGCRNRPTRALSEACRTIVDAHRSTRPERSNCKRLRPPHLEPATSPLAKVSIGNDDSVEQHAGAKRSARSWSVAGLTSAHCCISLTGYGCDATPVTTAWPLRLCLSSFAGVPTHVGHAAPECALLSVRTAWGEPSASELGLCGCGVATVSWSIGAARARPRLQPADVGGPRPCGTCDSAAESDHGWRHADRGRQGHDHGGWAEGDRRLIELSALGTRRWGWRWTLLVRSHL